MEARPEAAGGVFFSPASSLRLGRDTAAVAGVPLAGLEERAFEGGEFKLRPLSSVRGKRAWVLQSLAGNEQAPVADRLIRLLFLLSVLRDAGASEVIALIPYLAFARKERRTQPRDPVNTRYVAELLEAAGADRVIALDVHSPAAFDNAFRVPTDHLTALPMMAAELAGTLEGQSITVVSPDVGGIKRAQLMLEALESATGAAVELAFIEKRRALGRLTTGRLVGELQGRTALIVDDLCATGGTLIRAAERCLDAGAGAIHVSVTHAPHPPGLRAVASARGIARILTTDSAFNLAGPDVDPGPNVRVLAAAELFGAAVRRIDAGLPLAPLLTDWPAPVDQ